MKLKESQKDMPRDAMLFGLVIRGDIISAVPLTIIIRIASIDF